MPFIDHLFSIGPVRKGIWKLWYPFLTRRRRGQDVLFLNYAFETEVLVASVRHPMHVHEAAMMGAHVATCPLSVLLQLCKHPLTDIGLAKFLSDWEKVPQ